MIEVDLLDSYAKVRRQIEKIKYKCEVSFRELKRGRIYEQSDFDELSEES